MNNLLYVAWQPSEVIFQLGPLPIRWYGMCWLVGLALGYFYDAVAFLSVINSLHHSLIHSSSMSSLAY